MGVMEVQKDGLHLIEYNDIFTIDEIIEATEADLIINHPNIMKVK